MDHQLKKDYLFDLLLRNSFVVITAPGFDSS
ncbi:MAG: hypothetical protein Ct9H90mP19_4440 [Gammaproteobacteria bacterium]|nr:MAG: hypothetical protein Ct9H90mP19_4440 [Gammaproteobacteria bacterium]